MSAAPMPKDAINGHSKPLLRRRMAQGDGARMGKEEKKTAQLAQELPARITIGERRDGRSKPFFVRHGNPRVTISFEKEVDRNERAAALASASQEHGRSILNFDPAEWREFQEWKKARRPSCTVAEAVAAYIERRRGDTTGDSFRHIRASMERFSAFAGPVKMGDISRAQVEAWLGHVKAKFTLGPASLRHHRKDLNVFFSHEVRAERLAKNPVESVEVPKIPNAEEVTVMDLKDVFHFFKVNRNERAIGRLALEAFAGLRTSSAARLSPEEIDHHDKGLVLPGSKHKSGKRHFVDGWPRNLWKWIEHAPADCWELKPSNYSAKKALAFAWANLTNPGNVFRHTFATMHLAAFKDAPALAVLMTHWNTAMLRAHYRGRGVPQATAKAFFKITPRTVLLPFERFCRMCGINQPTP